MWNNIKTMIRRIFGANMINICRYRLIWILTLHTFHQRGTPYAVRETYTFMVPMFRSKSDRSRTGGDFYSRRSKLLRLYSCNIGDKPSCITSTTNQIQPRNVDSKINNYGGKWLKCANVLAFKFVMAGYQKASLPATNIMGKVSKSVVECLLVPTNLL